MSIGTQLRQAREAQALSLEQAAQATRIRLHYLAALEENRFDSLPSTAQLRGFLRAYGDYLKLNSSTLVQELEGDLKFSDIISKPPAISVGPVSAATNSTAIFKEVGQNLRSQRQLMGLSLDDVERHTHIRSHYVQALEEGDISHLPSPVQGRGMLSNYASFLGLNTEDVLLRFADGLQASLYDRQAARNVPKSKSRPAGADRMPARPSQWHRLFSMDLFAGGLLITFLLGFTIWGAIRISNLRTGKAPSPTAPPVSEILLSTPAAGTSTTATQVSTPLMLTASPVAEQVTLTANETQLSETEPPVVLESTPQLGNAPIQVYIVARQRAWMRIKVDGEIIFEGRVVPGSAYTFAGNDQIELRTGDAGSLQVYFNQQDLGVLGTFGEVVEKIFTVQGMQTATPAVRPTGTPAPTGTPTPTNTPGSTSKPVTPSVTPFP